ncbi:MAG: HD-GYP domain-containing protein [Anaerocolumna sp.]
MITFDEIYNQGIRISQNIVEDIRFGRKLYLEPVIKLSIEICKYINTNSNNNIFVLLNGVQDKNPYMFSHPVNVAFISASIGKLLNMIHTERVDIVCAALLHDVGKAKIKDSLLNKKDHLTLDEIDIIRTHPVRGYKILESVNLFNMKVLQGVLFHHERMDGTGYPLGIKGENINIFARIIAIADTFDSITATKAYRRKMSPFQAIEEIQASSVASLDSVISKIFVTNFFEYYMNCAIQ